VGLAGVTANSADVACSVAGVAGVADIGFGSSEVSGLRRAAAFTVFSGAFRRLLGLGSDDDSSPDTSPSAL
jgi:hypothetical protein